MTDRAPARPRGTRSQGSAGVWYGVGAYGLWGVLPVYLAVLAPSGPWEIVAHRILWSGLFCVALLLLQRRFRAFLAAVRPPATAAALTLAGALIAVNWTGYVVAATSGRITEAALGYFLNPLVSIALGLAVLGERLRPGQWAAVVVGGAGALYLVVASGSPPWIALLLAFSFGAYGLVKKKTGVSLGAVESLSAETLVLAPVAVGLLVWCQVTGRATFGALGPGHAALLVGCGVVTAVPLLLFASAARRVTLVTIGLLQFIAPVLQFVMGLAMGEEMSPTRWIGFGIVWLAVCILVADTLVWANRMRRTRLREDDRLPA